LGAKRVVETDKVGSLIEQEGRCFVDGCIAGLEKKKAVPVKMHGMHAKGRRPNVGQHQLAEKNVTRRKGKTEQEQGALSQPGPKC
jgi:hypothetical protein